MRGSAYNPLFPPQRLRERETKSRGKQVARGIMGRGKEKYNFPEIPTRSTFSSAVLQYIHCSRACSPTPPRKPPRNLCGRERLITRILFIVASKWTEIPRGALIRDFTIWQRLPSTCRDRPKVTNSPVRLLFLMVVASSALCIFMESSYSA